METNGTGAHASSQRGEDREEQILEAAAELFRRRGYSATSLQAVADRVGLHKSTLYHYFASKDELLFRIVQDVGAGVDRVADDVAGLDLDPVERIAAYLRSLIAIGAAEPAKAAVFRDDLAQLSAPRLDEQLALRRRQCAALAGLIAEAPIRPGIDASPDVLAELLIGAARGMLAYRGAPEPSSAEAATMVDLLIRAIAA
jgi:AcrR family transcriptional regulator